MKQLPFLPHALLITATLAHLLSFPGPLTAQTEDPLAAALEAARKTRDFTQLESLRAQFEQSLSQSPNNAAVQFRLARVESYLADAAEMRNDKKGAVMAVDKAIEAAQRSLQIDEKSADAHSLLADLYGRKIPLGIAMFAGPHYGPKVDQENKRAMALDDKNPRVWASLGRQYLLTPKTFGGDVSKAIDSFQKSLALDSSQDETWTWLAKAYQKQGDKAKALDAIHRALELNPQSPSASELSDRITH